MTNATAEAASGGRAAEARRPFESATELREQHARLLDALDEAMEAAHGPDSEAEALRAVEARIVAFLERAAHTGAYLEEQRERTACQSLLDFWVSSLARVGVQAPATRLAAFDAAQLPDLAKVTCPYVGLEAFRGKEFFFGRDADIKSAIAQVQSAPLLVVLGSSGSGKSSLVMGGVLPGLAAMQGGARWRIGPVFVPGNDVLLHLVETILTLRMQPADAALEAEKVRADPAYVLALLGDQTGPVLVTIDQFEEIFTLADEVERKAAAQALGHLLHDGRHRVILTMREEFRSRLVELENLVPLLDKAWYSMRPMGYAELRAAVERPAQLVNLQFQPDVVDDLVKKVLGQPAALPLLQFTLRELWNKRDRNRITWEVYRKVGDPLNALRTSADAFYEGLAVQTQTEVRRILLELVHVDELLEAYRRPVNKSVLLRAGKADTEAVLELLAANDYVRIDAGDDPVVEVKHEALIRNWPRLVGWIDEKRIEQRRRLAVTQAALRWAASGKPREGLLTGWQLQEAAARQGDLSPLEREFVELSAAEVGRAQQEKERRLEREAEEQRQLAERLRLVAEREIRMRKRTTAALTGLIVVLLVFGSAAWLLFSQQRRQQQAEREIGEAAKRLAEQAQTQYDDQKAEYARLRAEYDQLFATQVRQAVVAGSGRPSSQPVEIYLHISDESQRARAQTISEQLRKNQIGVAPRIEMVPGSPETSQVRYFRPEDKRGAEEIQRLLTEYLGVPKVRTAYIGGYQWKVPARRYEVWFGRDAFEGDALMQRPKR